MKLTLKSITDKAIAMVMFVLFTEISVAIGLGISCMYDYHFYASDYKTYAAEEAMRSKSAADIRNIVEYCALTQKEKTQSLTDIEQNKLNAYMLKYTAGATNVRFDANIEGTDIRLSNMDGTEPDSHAFSRYYEDIDYDTDGMAVHTCIHFYVLRDLKVHDSYRYVAALIAVATYIRYPIIALFCLSIIVALYIMGALMSSIEVVDENGNLKRDYFINKIPFDLFILLAAFVFGFFAVLIALTAVADVKDTNIVLWNAIILIICFFVALIALAVNLSVASRIKRGHVYKNTLIFKTIAGIRKRMGKEKNGYFKVPFIGKAMLTVGIAVLIELAVLIFFVYSYCTNESGLLSDFKFIYYVAFWALTRFILVPIFFMMAMNLSQLRETGQRLAEGDYRYDIDAGFMFGDFRQMSANLTQIKKEMVIAAEEKNKSYALRSELITNISHDIKTPLTSIVNYVDLLRHSGTDAAESDEYLDILQSQSVKLKKLLEDLIEVSKLTTGDVSVNMDTLDITMFAEQTVGEFADQLEEAGLELVCNYANEEMLVHADGDQLWRVFQNLIGNILKYAQSGTRVYLEIVPQPEDKVRITFKNISNTPILFDGQELLRRFARGDTSRHSEGYGLGLSIAKSLTEIQNGTFDVAVDGDLFRVDLVFQAQPMQKNITE